MLRDRIIRALGSIVVLLGVAAILGGCGSSASTSGSGADPASVAPAGAIAYFSAVVRPSGSLKAGAVDAARAVSHLSDPFGRLMQLAERSATARGAGFNYARDIAPWLGSRVGGFVEAASGGSLTHPAYAVIADSTNSSKAMAFIKSTLSQDSHGQSLASRSYRGTSYDTFGSGREAGGIVRGFAVYGTEQGVRAVIGAANGGAVLTGSSMYASSGAAHPPGALADGYINFDSLVRIISASTGAEGSILGLSLGRAGLHSVGMTLSASGSSIAVNVFTSLSSGSGTQASGTPAQGAAETVASLPGDAWLGIGLGDLGAGVSRALRQLGGVSGGSPLANALFSRLDSQLHGLRIERDILPWLGDTGLFASGSSLQTIGGALVIRSKRPAASKAAVSRIRAALGGVRGLVVRAASVPGADAAISVDRKGVPFVVYIVDGQGRFAVALGAQAAAQALRPSHPLARSADYQAASAELGPGVKPAFLLSIPALAGLVLPRLPAATAARVKPYLDAFTVLTFGGTRSGSRTTARFVVGLR